MDATDALLEQPQDEVITRRMQFRMKKTKREKKQQQKQQKLADKAKKQEEKELKKRDKEKQKTEKIEMKAKAKAAKVQKVCQKRLCNKSTLQHLQQEDTASAEIANADKKAQDEEFTASCKVKAKVGKTKKTKKRRSKLAKAKLLAARAKAATKVDKVDANALQENGSSSQAAKARKRRRLNQPSAGEKEEAIEQKTAEEKQTKGKQTKSKKQTVQPCDETVKLVQATLQECEHSNCTHPNWETVQYDPKKIQLSVYWSRNAIGIKVAKEKDSTSNKKGRVSGKAGPKSKWSQVAYFSCKSSCIYTNMVLGYQFVPCMYIAQRCMWCFFPARCLHFKN